MSEFNPLVERVDALLKRHQQQQANAAPPAEVVHEPLPPQAEVAVAAPAPAPAPAPAIEAVVPTAETDDDIPVLTEIVDPEQVPAFAAGIESAILEKLLAELDRSLEMRLNRTIGEVLEQVMDGLRAELSTSVRHMVREAVTTALAREIAERSRSS